MRRNPTSISALWLFLARRNGLLAISSRMIEATAAARESAARLSAEAAASIPRGRAEVTVLSCSIEP